MSRARRFDTVLRWFVQSRSRERVEHLVDLEAYGGNGRCECEHFQFTLERKLKDGAKASDETRCHHIQEARAELADLLITKKTEEKKHGSRLKRKP
jgi:hypothetical protein